MVRVCECGKEFADRFRLCIHKKTCIGAPTINEGVAEVEAPEIKINGKPIRSTINPIRVSVYDLIACKQEYQTEQQEQRFYL